MPIRAKWPCCYSVSDRSTNDIPTVHGKIRWQLACNSSSAVGHLTQAFLTVIQSLKLILNSKHVFDHFCNTLHVPAGIQACNLSISLQYTVPHYQLLRPCHLTWMHQWQCLTHYWLPMWPCKLQSDWLTQRDFPIMASRSTLRGRGPLRFCSNTT